MMNYLKKKTSEPATYNRINVEISEMKQMKMNKKGKRIKDIKQT